MKKIIFALILVSVTAMPAFADWELDLKNFSASLDIQASSKDGETDVAGALSLEFNASPDLIIKKRTETGLTYGELAVAFSIAKQTNKNVDIVIHEYKKEGKAWGKIAKRHGVRTEELVHSMGKVKDKAKGRGAEKAKGHGKGRGKKD